MTYGSRRYRGTMRAAALAGAVAFVCDGQVVSAPMVWEAITGGSLTLTGEWTEDEARALVTSLVS